MAIERELRRGEQDRAWATTSPSGLAALEIDTDTASPSGLTDAQLIDAIVGFERLTGWAQARQARLLAEFARRRPGDDPTLVATDKPCTISTFAPDEIGLALKNARLTAKETSRDRRRPRRRRPPPPRRPPRPPRRDQ